MIMIFLKLVIKLLTYVFYGHIIIIFPNGYMTFIGEFDVTVGRIFQTYCG